MSVQTESFKSISSQLNASGWWSEGAEWPGVGQAVPERWSGLFLHHIRNPGWPMSFSLWNFFLNKGFCRGVIRKSDASEAAQWQSGKGARTHCPLALNLLSSSQRDWKGNSSSAGCTAWKLPPQRVKAENRWCWCSKTRSSLVSSHRGSFPQKLFTEVAGCTW